MSKIGASGHFYLNFMINFVIPNSGIRNFVMILLLTVQFLTLRFSTVIALNGTTTYVAKTSQSTTTQTKATNSEKTKEAKMPESVDALLIESQVLT